MAMRDAPHPTVLPSSAASANHQMAGEAKHRRGYLHFNFHRAYNYQNDSRDAIGDLRESFAKPSMEAIHIQYRFKIKRKSLSIFDLHLDPQTIEMVGTPPVSPPPWTRLDHFQCPHCPLKASSTPYCPLSLRLVPIIGKCSRLLSYDKVRVEIRSEQRCVSVSTTAQRGLRSLMGLVMATSGCPHTAFFKPMARFHLPFANDQETLYRATSMYFLAQYFVAQDGREAKFDLAGLTDIYNRMHILNTSLAQRLRGSSESDSTLNALVLLDVFTKVLPHAIRDSLRELRPLFHPYLKDH